MVVRHACLHSEQSESDTESESEDELDERHSHFNGVALDVGQTAGRDVFWYVIETGSHVILHLFSLEQSDEDCEDLKSAQDDQ